MLTAEHQLKDFDCGLDSLNHWLVKRARDNHGRGASRVYVLCEGTQKVVGYYCLSAGGIDHQQVAGAFRRNMPDPIPVLVLGRLAVDKKYHGRGIGQDLVRDALLRTMQTADIAGVAGVVVQAINQAARVFWYQRCGFQRSPIDENLLYLSIQSIRKQLSTPPLPDDRAK